MQYNAFTLHFERVFFLVLKDFDQSQELKTIAKKSLQFFMFPTRFCYMEDVWKVRMNICTALRSFVNFCCLSQSEVSTDNRKVSTFFAFQHVRCVVAIVLIWTVT